MGRSGYSDDLDPQDLAMWRGQVASAIRGKRGQAFLREMIEALDAMPEKRLIAKELRQDGEVCAIGSVGAKRGVDLEALDPHDYEAIAATFGVARQLVQEIEFMNDDECFGQGASAEERWKRMRAWAVAQLKSKEGATMTHPLLAAAGIHDKLADCDPKLRRGQVWCLKCGHTQKVNTVECFRHGWPLHCGSTMTIDAPDERKS